MAEKSSKVKSLINEIKTHWNEPDHAAGKYVPYREYGRIFTAVAMNYGVQSPQKYISFTTSAFIIMYIYKLPYITFSVVTLIGLPLTYLWNLLSWLIGDNLGFLEKKTQRRLITFYSIVIALGLAMMCLDVSVICPAKLTALLNSINGINARSFFKIFAVQIFINAYTALRDILWRKKLVPKYGRYKYTLFANYVQKCIAILCIGWIPIYNIKDVDERFWIAYLIFQIYTTYTFENVVETCTETISPNPRERLMVRTWPVKLSHLLENLFTFMIPLIGIGFDDIRFYRYVLPSIFIPLGGITLWAVKPIKERIPQPPLEKKQNIPFWYGITQVMKNKYRWLNMISDMIDSLGNGAVDFTNVMYFFSMRLYTQGVLYGVLKLLMSFRSTPPSFFAPYFIRKFSYKSLRIFKQLTEILRCLIVIAGVFFFPERQMLTGILIFAAEFVYGMIRDIPHVAQKDMNIRLGDYQMYISGERLEKFSGVFTWFTSPITTLVSLIIPIIILRSGFNSNWDVLFIDSQRFSILAVPVLFDLVGHVLMIIPYLFWDYDNEKHNYVMEVLKQRERLANEGYFPMEYEGGLDFEEATELKAHIPVNFEEQLKRRDEATEPVAAE